MCACCVLVRLCAVCERLVCCPSTCLGDTVWRGEGQREEGGGGGKRNLRRTLLFLFAAFFAFVDPWEEDADFPFLFLPFPRASQFRG